MIDTCPSLPGIGAIDTTLTLFTEQSEFILACNDNCEGSDASCGVPQSCLSPVVGPGTYFIRVATIGAAGNFQLNISFSPACPDLPTPSIEWIHQFGSLWGRQDFAQATDGDGNYFYVAGSVGGVLPGQNDLPGSDAFLRKYDSQGNEIWTSQFGTSSNDDVAADEAVDASGVYVVEASRHAAGPVPLRRKGRLPAERRRWKRGLTHQFGTAEEDQAFSVAADATGIYVVASQAACCPAKASLVLPPQV
jgi:hypothetical protein